LPKDCKLSASRYTLQNTVCYPVWLPPTLPGFQKPDKEPVVAVLLWAEVCTPSKVLLAWPAACTLVQRADEKIGPGVENVTVSPHLNIRGVRCFTLLRKDGSVKNFSYRKTLAAMLGDGWEGYQLPELVRLQQLVSAGRKPLCQNGEGRFIDQVPTVTGATSATWHAWWQMNLVQGEQTRASMNELAFNDVELQTQNSP
jgi:Protein of unknown function (DUF3223)